MIDRARDELPWPTQGDFWNLKWGNWLMALRSRKLPRKIDRAVVLIRFSAEKWWSTTAEALMLRVEEGDVLAAGVLADCLEDQGCDRVDLLTVLRGN